LTDHEGPVILFFFFLPPPPPPRTIALPEGEDRNANNRILPSPPLQLYPFLTPFLYIVFPSPVSFPVHSSRVYFSFFPFSVLLFFSFPLLITPLSPPTLFFCDVLSVPAGLGALPHFTCFFFSWFSILPFALSLDHCALICVYLRSLGWDVTPR